MLVLLHGIGSNAGSFTPLLPHLPSDWRVIAWNAPGYGRSRSLETDWPLAADYASALKALLDRLGLERVLLAGHSLGCLMAAAFADSEPGRVSRLLLSSPALGHGVPKGGALSGAAQARIDDLAKLGPEAFAAARAPRLVFAPEDNPQIVARVREGMARVTMAGYVPAVRMLASGRLLDDAVRLQVPTDVLVGEHDLITPPEAAHRLHAALQPSWRGRLSVLPASGHALYQQSPAAFAAALQGLMEAPAEEGPGARRHV